MAGDYLRAEHDTDTIKGYKVGVWDEMKGHIKRRNSLLAEVAALDVTLADDAALAAIARQAITAQKNSIVDGTIPNVESKMTELSDFVSAGVDLPAGVTYSQAEKDEVLAAATNKA